MCEVFRGALFFVSFCGVVSPNFSFATGCILGHVSRSAAADGSSVHDCFV